MEQTTNTNLQRKKVFKFELQISFHFFCNSQFKNVMHTHDDGDGDGYVLYRNENFSLFFASIMYAL